MMPISWVVWNECNARAFRDKSAPTMVIVLNMKKEVGSWVSVGAK